MTEFHYPAFKPHFSVSTFPPDFLLLRHEDGCRVLEGRLLVLIADFLDGKHTVEDITAKLDDQVTAIDVEVGLEFLAEEGVLTDDRSSNSERVYAHALNAGPGLESLRETAVSITALDGISPEPIAEALRSLGVQVSDNGSLAVVLTTDYLHDSLGGINKEAYTLDRPYLLVRPVGSVLWIGPLFSPGLPCWECLAKRLRENRRAGGFLDVLSNPPLPALPTTMRTAFDIAATEVWKWIVQDRRSDLAGSMVTLDTKTLVSQRHTVVRQANCPVCAQVAEKDGQVFPALTSRLKRFITDGGHRAEPPELTFAKNAHHISGITGVVGRFESYDSGIGAWLNVYVAEHLSRPEDEIRLQKNRKLRRPSAGKGMSEAQARTSALCEALERYSGLYRGDERRIRSTYRSLRDDAVHPDTFQNYSSSQYENRYQWNARHARMHAVMDPFDENAEVDWCPAWSLTDNRIRYVPAAAAYYRYPSEDGRRFCRGDSSGCAAGSCMEEAILQGFLELVERDCTGIWWYNRLRRPAVDMSSFEHPYMNSMVDRYRELSRDLWVLDISNDLGFPVFAAISKPSGSHGEDCIMGFGAHPDPMIAIARAVTEVNQFLPHTIAGGFPDYQWEPDGYSFLLPDTNQAPKRAQDFPYTYRDDLLDDVLASVERLRMLGMEIIVLDQTRPDVGLPVVKVIAPGLRHVWARFGPGRLYDVPVKMNWLAVANIEEKFESCCFFA